MFRIYIERKAGFQNEARRIYSEVKDFLGISGVTGVRYLNRYDIENTTDEVANIAAKRIFSEAQSDTVFFGKAEIAAGDTVIISEYLPGQYDQRADSAEQCLTLLRESLKASTRVGEKPPRVRCAKVVVLSGNIAAEDVKRIENYLVNPVDSRLTNDSIPETLEMKSAEPADIPVVAGFVSMGEDELAAYRAKMGLAMDEADVKWMQDYFKSISRDPTETEIRVLDTYWSDHCRHTTFSTELTNIAIEDGDFKGVFEKSLENYHAMRTELYAQRTDKKVTLMDMATIGAKYLRKHGKLEDLEVSEENNACSIFIDVKYTDAEKAGETERWLLQFKNETHNHPTEIEPFGGAATCIGGAIRDPLSGRAWVYQAMRITGAADPTVPLSATLHGKLPQVKLTREAAQGFSSYGNQIGLTTGQVAEIYHPGYVAKRMELGAVIAASPYKNVLRETPEAGDIVVLVGGGTGRDGIGGATGSSKVHTEKSVTTAAAEVQKGNAVEERKIQRLFRKSEVSGIIRRSNDFGAGGVSVAVGELASGLDINLDAVPKKYEGLNGTELAISESQERMAVVVRAGDVEKFIKAANAENLNAVVVATVTDTNKLVMKWRGKTIVSLDRSFLDTAGAPHAAAATLPNPKRAECPIFKPLASVSNAQGTKEKWLANIADLACCSERGLGERFDGSIGASSVLMPYGGKYQCTHEAGMVAKIPVASPRETSTVSLMSYGYDPRLSEWSAWHGAQYAVMDSLVKILCMGGNPAAARLTFQEFFGRAVDEKSWGKPAAALLGALDAQKSSGCASIGGKDSMSGTFEHLNVPNTLVSFAVATDDVKNITSGAFKKAGSSVYVVDVPRDEQFALDWTAFLQIAASVYELNKAGKIRAMYPVGAGGIAEAVSKMAMGNRIGAALSIDEAELFGSRFASFIVETDENLAFGRLIGKTISAKEITVGTTSIALSDIESAWEKTLAKVFPPVSSAEKGAELPSWAKAEHDSLAKARVSFTAKTAKATPRVVIPVFPGTNCEFDMARAFNLAGAETQIVVLRNRTSDDLASSLNELKSALDGTQILALAGGFSAGDEPDGSGKFIANVLRESRIADAVMSLLKQRDGLILGICNGFQALIKTGLVPYGEIRDVTEDMPTLTFNTIGRHISRVARTRVVSAASPWAQDKTVIEPKIHLIPISHGEGRIIITESLAKDLFARGQVFSQYVDENAVPTMSEPDNPNGSLFAIEGLTSPDGRVLGKMGHNERCIGTSGELLKNITTGSDDSIVQNIFRAGVSYFS